MQPYMINVPSSPFSYCCKNKDILILLSYQMNTSCHRIHFDFAFTFLKNLFFFPASLYLGLAQAGPLGL